MVARPLTRMLGDQRGMALPLALMVLMILSALVPALLVLSVSEPVIAGNQMRWSQARAVAEAGVERAIWGLNNPTDSDGIPDPLVTAAAPYNGGQLVNVAVNGTVVGGFRVSVSNGAAANERDITATGYVPSDTAPRGQQRITVTVTKVRFPDPPAALSVRGELQVSGNTLIDSRADNSCGAKVGTFSTGFTTVGSGAADVYGADGNSTRNQSTDIYQNRPTAEFDTYALTTAELDALRALAKARGTYYQGTVTFNSSTRMPNGLVFVDTVSGTSITDATPAADFASVSIHGNAPEDPSGIFSGWLIVNGSLSISGNFQMRGFGYVVNDFTYTGTGTGLIEGAMMSQNTRDTSSTTIDTNTGGNASIIYNCQYARTGNGQVPLTYQIKGGTYREVAGS